jgi:hypothetical protein
MTGGNTPDGNLYNKKGLPAVLSEIIAGPDPDTVSK